MLISMKLTQNKKIAVISLIIFFLFFLIPFPSFATSEEPPSFTSSLTRLTSSTSTNNFWVSVSNNADPVYFALYPGGYPNSFGVAMASVSSFTANYSFNGSSISSSASSTNTSYPPYYTLFSVPGVNYSRDTSLLYFSSSTLAFDYLIDYIENPPSPPSSGYTLDYSLPAGNVIYIDITNHSEEIILTQTTPLSYWSYTSTQYSGVVSSLPSSSGFVLPITGTTVISWSGSGKSDSFGKYSSWISSQVVSGQTTDHGHAYFVVVNPLANNFASSNGTSVDSVANSYINISVPYANSFKVYPLKESFNAGVYDNENPEGTNNGNGEPDGEGGWAQTGDDGEAWTPEYGGLTTPESNENTIHDFLQRISQDISGFFGGAIGAVKTLVSAGSDFFNVLVGLYSWLPPAVLSVLSSALILVITIGVVKVFI